MINVKQYRLIKELDLTDQDCHVCYLEHNKTKAKVIILANEDTNKAFTIGFKTPPTDDTGVCHIIEHTVLSGSVKYPVKEPFLELLKYSLNTFLNAMTYPDRTLYPISSCNLKDYKNLMDVYLDAVFNPLIYQKEELFKQEGWHYELDKAEDDITVNGIVYNEMKGAFSSADDCIGRLIMKALFPDNCYQYESGGDPVAIPDLTYDAFLKYHREHYHPTNSVIVLYGKMDYEERLTYLDQEYLSKYDYLNKEFPILEAKPFNEMPVITDTYQIAPGKELHDETYLTLGIAFPTDLSLKEKLALDIIIMALFEVNGAPIEEAILKQGIGKVVNTYFSTDVYQPFLEITVEKSDKEKAESLLKLLNEEFIKASKDGLKPKTLEGIIKKALFKKREKDYGKVSKGIIYALSIIPALFYGDESFNYFATDNIFHELLDEINTSYFQDLITKYLINNNHRAFVVLQPSATKAEIEKQALKDKLAAFKNTKSADEIKDLVEATENIKAYLKKEDDPLALKTIPLLKLSDIEELKVEIKNEEKYINNCLAIHHNYETNDILHFDLLYSLENINEETLKKIALVNALLFGVSTTNLKYSEISEECGILLGRSETAFQLISVNDQAYFALRFSVLKENLKDAFKLLQEIFFETIFTEKEHIKDLLSSGVSQMESNFAYRGNTLALDFCKKNISKIGYIQYHTTGFAFYRYVKDILNNYDEAFEALAKELPIILKHLFAKNKLILSITCNDELYKISEGYFANLIQKMDCYEYDEDLTIKDSTNSLSVLTPYNVNYCAKVIDTKEKIGGSRLVLTKILNTDYLWKKVRVQGGAYGASISTTRDGKFFMSSYRDPKLDETYQAYDGIMEYLDKLELTDEDITKYIIGTIGDNYFPKSVRILGNASMEFYLCGIMESDLEQEKEEILKTTLKDLKNYLYVLAKAKQKVICALTNQNIINSSKLVFDESIELIK